MSKFKTPFLPLPSFLFLLLSRVHFGDWDDDDQRCKSRISRLIGGGGGGGSRYITPHVCYKVNHKYLTIEIGDFRSPK